MKGRHPMSTDTTLLIRRDAAAYLSQHGFPIKPATLSAYASRGGGPRYRRWGQRALYDPADLLAWAATRLGASAASTAERDT